MNSFKNVFITKNSKGVISKITKDIYNNGLNIRKSQMITNNNILIYKIQCKEKEVDIYNSILYKHNIDDIFDLDKKYNFDFNNHYQKKLEIECCDNTGIIHNTSKALEELDINISKLESNTYHAPITSTELFNLRMEIDIPIHVKEEDISNKMEKLIDIFNIELKLV